MPGEIRQRQTLRLLAVLFIAVLLISSCSPVPTANVQPTSASPTSIPQPLA